MEHTENLDCYLVECAGCWTRHPKQWCAWLFGKGPYCRNCTRTIIGIHKHRIDQPASIALQLRGKGNKLQIKTKRLQKGRPDVMLARIPPRKRKYAIPKEGAG